MQSDSPNKSTFDTYLARGNKTDGISIASNNFELIRAYFYMLGVNFDIYSTGESQQEGQSKSIPEVSLRFLTDEDIDFRAGKTVRLVGPASDALHDPSLFGEPKLSENKSPLQYYAKLPFNTEMIMPTILHTNEVPKLIYAKILKPDKDPEYRTLSRNIVNGIIDCDDTHKGFGLIGWEHYGTLDKNSESVREIKTKLDECGIEVPDDFTDIYIPVLKQVSCKKDLPEDSKKYNRVGISAIIEIFKNYSLFSSIFFSTTHTSTQSSSDESEEITDSDENEEIADNVENSDDSLEVEVVASDEADSLVKIEHDEADDTAEDDTDIQEGCGDTVEDEISVEDIDSATIEKEIPSFRALVMLLRNYPTKYGNVLANFIVTGMLIPPNMYRPVVADDSSRNNPIDVCLNAIYDQVKSGTNTPEDINKLYKKLRHCILTGTDKKAPSIIDQIKDHKSGMSLLRDTSLSKRVSYSARSVISIGRDLQFGECGIPVCMLTTIFMNQLVNIYSNSAHVSDDLKNKGVTLTAFQSNGVNITTPREVNKALVCLSNRNYAGFKEIDGARNVKPSDFDKLYRGLVNNLTKLLKEQPCILNREPSLHMFSMQGFKVKPIDYYTIQLHPLNCHGFNADFDGDQMAAIFPMHEKGRRDTINNVMARKHLIDPKDCSGIISLNQDMILGLYYATIHKDNAVDTKDYYAHYTLGDVKKFYTLPVHTKFTEPVGHSFGVAEPIMNDILAGIIKLHDLVYCQYDNRTYLAEAGRFLANAILPNGMGFTESKLNTPTGSSDAILDNVQLYKLFIDKAITKKTINPILDACIQHFIKCNLDVDDNGDHLADVYNRFMNLGFIAADISGISLSLNDFAELPVKSLIASEIENTEQSVSMADTWFDLGFCTEQEHDNLTNDSWVNTVTECKNEIKQQFARAGTPGYENSAHNFVRNSNIYMIIDSGARGDVNQLLEMSGMIGVVYNATNEQIKNPILSSYMDGLSPMDFASNAYTARRQISAAQLTTADSGAVTRDLIYLAEHLHIRNDNECCKTPTPETVGEFLSVPCIYTATTADDEEIRWLIGDGQAIGNVKVITNDNTLNALFDHFAKTENSEDLRLKLWETEDELEQLFISDLINYVEHKSGKLTEAKSYYAYLQFMHQLNTAKEPVTDNASLEAIAGNCRQRYAYIAKTDASNHLVAFGLRPYHLKLSQLSRSMLKWRITNKELIPNAPFGTDNSETNAKYLWPEDKPEETLLDTDIVIDDSALKAIEDNLLAEVPIYSMLTCTSSDGICRKCFGIAYDTFKLPRPGTLIGYSGIQSIANPMSQLILDSHKSEYSNDESAMSKIKRTTSSRHVPVTRTVKTVLKMIKDSGQAAEDMPILDFTGFVTGECGVIAVDGVTGGKCKVTVFEKYSTNEGKPLIVKSSKVINISQMKISPTIISDPKTGSARVLSAEDTDKDLAKEILSSELSESFAVPTGTVITDFDQYGLYMGCADQTNEEQCARRANRARFAYWEALCKCFTKDTILSRNFEVFARALTEFGIAKKTSIENNIIAGYTYAIPKLIKANVPYQPVIEKSASARTLADKLMTDIAHSNPIAKINLHVANGTIQTNNTHLGNQVLGNSGQIITRPVGDSYKMPTVAEPSYIQHTTVQTTTELTASVNSSGSEDYLSVGDDYTDTQSMFFTENEGAIPLVDEQESEASVVVDTDSLQTQVGTTSMF